MDDFELELKKGFLDEATQLLSEAEQCFLEIEANPSDSKLFEKIFRIVHNIKGSSRGVGFEDLGQFAHEFESFLLRVKSGELKSDSQVVNLLLRGNDQIKIMVEGLRGDFNSRCDFSALVGELKNFVPTSEAVVTVEATEAPAEFSADVATVAVADPAAATAAAKDAGDDISAEDVKTFERTVVGSVQSEPARATTEPVQPTKSAPQAADESIRVSLSRLEKLINFVGELSILQTVLQEQVYGENTQLLRKTAHQLGKVSKEVQDLSMSLRMVPVRQTFQKMQRIVRDTSAQLGKKVSFQLEGEETELDKTVLEAIADPLVHLVRNAVDHGIENETVRQATGKPLQGTIKLRAGHLSGKLLIEVVDDGGGISGERLLSKAIEKGVCKPGTRMSESDAVQLIFHPGFSTKTEVTEVSGRGVGMDVVKTNIEKLNGTVEVRTEVGKGTSFRVLLPLTLAIIDGLVVQTANERFVVPLSHVHETVKPKEAELHHLSALGTTLQLRGEALPAFSLSSLLSKSKSKVKEEIALIVRTQDQPFAILVEDVLRQQQVVVKRIGSELQGVRGYAGSAILGDGRPALILELGELVPKSSSSQKTKEYA